MIRSLLAIALLWGQAPAAPAAEVPPYPYLLTKSAAEKVQAEPKFSVKGASRSAEKVLDEILKARGLDRAIRDGACIVGLEGENKRFYRIWTKEEKDRAEKTIFAKKLSKPLAGPRVCDFIEGLRKDLGIEVYADGGVWPVDVAPPKNIEGMTVKQLADVLNRKKISLLIEPRPTNARPGIPFDRPPGSGTKLPPGTPRRSGRSSSSSARRAGSGSRPRNCGSTCRIDLPC